MSKRTTVFDAGDERYRADKCASLITALAAGDVEMSALARGTYPGRRLPPGTLPQVSTVGFWNAAHHQDWSLGEHRNEGIEITYLANGYLAFQVDGRPFSLVPGSLTITRPWQPHCVGNPNVSSSRLYWLILDVGVRQPHQPWFWPEWMVLSKHDIRELTALLRENEHPMWDGTAEIDRCFTELGRWVELSQTGNIPVSRLTLVINELLVCVLELLRARNPQRESSLTLGERSVAMFLDRLRDELAEPWTLEIMAERAGLGRTRFAQLCRKLTNLAPIAYLQLKRVEMARAKLVETRDTITSIALDCGFGSSAYFSSVFRSLMQCSPSEYRERNNRK